MIFWDVSNIRKFYFEELELVFILFKLFSSSLSSQIWEHSLIAIYKLTWWEAAMCFDLMMVTDKGLNEFVEEEKRWEKAAQLIINPEWWLYEWLKGNVDLELLIWRKNWWFCLWEVHYHKPRSSFFERLLIGHYKQVVILLDIEIVLPKQLVI